MKRYHVRSHGHRRGDTALTSPTYKSWQNMHSRCRRQAGYAGSVKVCDRWASFDAFLEDMGERPSLKHSIDRYPDRAGDYGPGNCRWATAAEQCRNKSNTVWLTHPETGETLCMADWAARLGVSRSTMHARVKRWPLARALGELP